MNKQYCLLHGHSYFSLLDSPSRPSQIAKRAVDLGMSAIALTDHRSVSGCIEFHKTIKKAGIRPILGCELDISRYKASIKDNDNRKTRHLVVLAKNFKGWRKLIQIVSRTNHQDNYYYRPRIDLESLAEYLDGNIISFSGHVGSDLADILFGDRFSEAYNARTIEDATACLDPDHYEKCKKLAEYHRDIFGKENFFLEIQNLNQDFMPAAKIIAEVLRSISKKTGIPCVATADAHFASPEYKQDQQILVANNLRADLKTIMNSVKNNEDVSLGGFFTDAIYHIPSLEEMKYNTEEELSNTNLIADMCEDYEVTAQPMLPKFPDAGETPDIDCLKNLCRNGWKNKLSAAEKKDPAYAERIKMELNVVEKWNLAGYFLIVQDIVKWAKDQGALVGCGRGSAGGCMISHLIDITTALDPLKYNLIFERFFNEGRCQPGRVALPDIDIDFPSHFRKRVFERFKEKYGADRFGHICTFQTMKGKAALKDCLRINNACDPFTQNDITSFIPDEAAISDDLEEMREAGENPSIIIWALRHKAKNLAKWAKLNDQGEIEGEMAPHFKQAIRLEGCKRQIGRHASAILLSDEPLGELVPMAYDKKNPDQPFCAFDMYAAEDVGQVKFDILGVNDLDKTMMCLEEIKKYET